MRYLLRTLSGAQQAKLGVVSGAVVSTALLGISAESLLYWLSKQSEYRIELKILEWI